MRFSASSAANAIAWAVVMLLIVAGLWLANRLGFIGLLLLGGMTCLVCIMAELDRNAPTWGTEVFKAQMDRRHSPEQKAAALEEDRVFLSPLRFYRWCGVFLMLVGVVGFAVQKWAFGSGHP